MSQKNQIPIDKAKYMIPKAEMFNFITENKAAQRYLLEISKTLSEEKIFETIYQTQVEWGKKEREIRDLEKKIVKEFNTKAGASYLDTPEKVEQYYDKEAKDITLEAMKWLYNKLSLSNEKNTLVHIPNQAEEEIDINAMKLATIQSSNLK